MLKIRFIICMLSSFHLMHGMDLETEKLNRELTLYKTILDAVLQQHIAANEGKYVTRRSSDLCERILQYRFKIVEIQTALVKIKSSGTLV